MKPIARNRKIELRFMDVKVSIEGNFRSIDQKAYSLMAALVGDRMRMAEVMSELHEYEDHEPNRKTKKQRIKADIEFLKMYA